MSLRSVHITNFYHQCSGGIGAFYRALLTHAEREQRYVRLIVPGEHNCAEPVGRYGLIYTVKAPASPFVDNRYRLLMPFGRSGAEVLRILKLEQPDILEISDKYSILYLSGFLRKRWIPGIRRPTEVATSHERLDDNVAVHLQSTGAAGRITAAWYLRYVYFPMFDHHIANSAYTAAELVPASQGHTTRRGIWICPMGINVRNFPFRERVPGDDKTLLYAGRLAKEKNVDVLPPMMERLPRNWRLLIAGDGPRRAWLQARVGESLPERIRFLGHVTDRTEFRNLLESSDVFVHPNPCEPFGITPLEAMATGVPLVAPRSGGILSYASDENAWLSHPTPEALADAALDVFRDEFTRQAKVQRARTVAENYDWTYVAARFFSLLDTLHLRGFGIEEPPLGAAIDAWNAVHSIPARDEVLPVRRPSQRAQSASS